MVGASEDSPAAPLEESNLEPSSLECGKCCRKFSNSRQLRKHICIIVLNLGEEEGEAGKCCLRADSANFSYRDVTLINIFFPPDAVVLGNSTYLFKSHLSGKVFVCLL